MSESLLLADDQPIDPDDETLVAYLDGELNNQERSSVEQRLIDDQEFRSRLQKLQSSWDWLGTLPNEAPSEKLMQSTIELVVSDLVVNQPKQGTWLSRNRGKVFLLGLCLTCFGAGVAFAVWKSNRSEYAQLSDLEIAEYLDAYSVDADFDLFRDLNASPSWNTMVSTYREFNGASDVDQSLIANVPVDLRPEKIAQLGLRDREFLDARWNEFQKLDEQSASEIRKTAAAVAQQNDAEELRSAMRAYAIWRQTLPASRRDELEKSSGVKRRQAIESAVNYTLEELSKASGRIMSDETGERIYYQLNRLLDERIDGDPDLAQAVENTSMRFDPERARRMYMAMMVFATEERRQLWTRRSSPGPSPPPLTDVELDAMIAILNAEAVEDLNALSNWNPFTGRNPMLALNVLQTWAEESVRRSNPSRPEETDFLDRYREHPRREVIDMLPPDDFLKELTPQSPWSRGPRRPGPPREPGGPPPPREPGGTPPRVTVENPPSDDATSKPESETP